MARSVDIKIDERVVHLKVQMDNLVEDIKEVNYELVELEALLKTQVERLKAKFDDKQLSLKTKKERLETQLRELFEQVPQTETITQRKVRLLNADVVIKKAKTDFEKDTDKLIEWAKVNEREELINKKEVLSFKWADFNKNANVTNIDNTGCVANTYVRTEHEAKLNAELKRLRETQSWRRKEIVKYQNADMKRSLKQRINKLQKKAEQEKLTMNEQRQLDRLYEQYNELLGGKEVL